VFRKLTPALLAPLLLVAACATESEEGTVVLQTGAAVDALRAAPEAVTEAGTAAFEMTMTMSAAGERYELTATGAADAAAGQVEMEMDLGSMLSGLAEASGETIPQGLDEPIRFVIDGTTVYLRMPILDVLTGSSNWLSASPEDLGQDAGSLGLGAGAFDPAALLDVLRGVADDVTEAGTDTVRGVATTKYTATISLADALAQAPADQRERLQAQLDQLGTDASMPVTVWVDEDGLPRRMTMDLTGLAGPGTDAEGAAVAITIEYFDYGEPVDIQIPPADEVTPFGEVLGGALGSGFGSPS
jgi:hypothetical protein